MIGVDDKYCCICLTDDDEKHITACNHRMCVRCLDKLVQLHPRGITCPICRTPLSISDHLPLVQNPPFDLHNYPINPDWSSLYPMLGEHDQCMLSSAYNAIHRVKCWEYMYGFVVNETRGFMRCNDTHMIRIMNAVNDDDCCGHSGATMAYTMRRMHFIARYGWEEFRINLMQNSR